MCIKMIPPFAPNYGLNHNKKRCALIFFARKKTYVRGKPHTPDSVVATRFSRYLRCSVHSAGPGRDSQVGEHELASTTCTPPSPGGLHLREPQPRERGSSQAVCWDSIRSLYPAPGRQPHSPPPLHRSSLEEWILRKDSIGGVSLLRPAAFSAVGGCPPPSPQVVKKGQSHAKKKMQRHARNGCCGVSGKGAS